MNTMTVRSRDVRVSSSFAAAISTRKAVPASMPFSVRYVPKIATVDTSTTTTRNGRGASFQPRRSAVQRHAHTASSSSVTHAGRCGT